MRTSRNRKLISILMLAGALFGCGGSSNTLSESDIERIRNDPRVQRSARILERANALRVTVMHLRYDGESAVETFSCRGSTCTGRRTGHRVSLKDFADPDADGEVDVKSWTLSQRLGFDTTRDESSLKDPSGVSLGGTGYGFWGDHGFAGIASLSGSDSENKPIRMAWGYVGGIAPHTTPSGVGSATWRGPVEAVSTRNYDRREGSATVSIPDLSSPRVTVTADVGGFALGGSHWRDLPVDRGQFVSTTRDMSGNFYGSGHQEVYGVFDTGPYVGVFGGKRQ